MKIVELKCEKCGAQYETLESIPTGNLKCPGCGAKEFTIKKTNKEFKGCSGGCKGCQSDCH